MKRTLVTLVFVVCLGGQAWAQTTPPATAPAPAATAPAPTTPAASAPALDRNGRPEFKAVREQCRDEVNGGAMKGPAKRRQAMADCIVKQRPDMEARMKCAMDPSLKGMDKDARRAAVKACIDKTKS